MPFKRPWSDKTILEKVFIKFSNISLKIHGLENSTARRDTAHNAVTEYFTHFPIMQLYSREQRVEKTVE